MEELGQAADRIYEQKRDDNLITKEEIRELLLKRRLEITQVIDEVIQLNHIIGVGLISLGDGLRDYCYKHKGYVKESISKPLQSSEQDNMNKIAGPLKETFSSILDPNRCELCPDINTSGNNVTCNIYHTVIPDINKHPSWCKMKG